MKNEINKQLPMVEGRACYTFFCGDNRERDTQRERGRVT